jgi:hypothetical protein
LTEAKKWGPKRTEIRSGIHRNLLDNGKQRRWKNPQNTRCVNIGCEAKISGNGNRNLKMNKKQNAARSSPVSWYRLGKPLLASLEEANIPLRFQPRENIT